MIPAPRFGVVDHNGIIRTGSGTWDMVFNALAQKPPPKCRRHTFTEIKTLDDLSAESAQWMIGLNRWPVYRIVHRHCIKCGEPRSK